jgi:ketosteroid isomerase-like protein
LSEALVRRWFDALARLDGEALAACYHPSASFSDPLFPDLRGARVGWRWRLLARGATDMRVSYDILGGDERKALVRWRARWRLAGSGRAVANEVESTFTFWDGRIVRQVDAFDFWRWSRSSLGPAGWLLGWIPALRRAAGRRALQQLDRLAASGAFREAACPAEAAVPGEAAAQAARPSVSVPDEEGRAQ